MRQGDGAGLVEAVVADPIVGVGVAAESGQGLGVGFPTPVVGAQAVPDALAARFRSIGGVIRTGSRVE
jgi:phytoene dehydrogenase-like protein